MRTSPPWLPEEIPEQDHVFYRVPEAAIRKNGRPHPGLFKENRGSMSVDWEKYSTAAETKNRTENPERFAVLRLPVAGLRAITGVTVVHDPIYEPDAVPPNVNRAHTAVFGVARRPDNIEIGYEERVRSSLSELVEDRGWEIPPRPRSASQFA